MLRLLNSYFTDTSSDSGPIVRTRKHSKPTNNYIYRDQLDRKVSSASESSPSQSKIKSTRSRAYKGKAKPLLQLQGDQDKSKKSDQEIKAAAGGGGGGLKVKVLMTKEQAARLLSKCKDGGGLFEFKDVARELAQIPTGRVSVVSSGTCSSDRLQLESIPEDVDP